LSELSPFATRESYDQKNAKGFIRILALPARTQARLLAKTK
jgi:argininosuccinate synthase